LTKFLGARTPERVRSFFSWLWRCLLPILRPVGLFDDAWTAEQGVRLRMRLFVQKAESEMGADGGKAMLTRALTSFGFEVAAVYTAPEELPSDWQAAGIGSAHAPNRLAWAEATWAQPTQSVSGGILDYIRIVRTDPAPSTPAASSASSTSSASSEAAIAKVSAKTRPEVRFTSDHSWGFYEKLVALARRHNWQPIGILSVMQSEAGMRANPPHNGPARGIIQFEPDILRGLGWSGTPDDFAGSLDAEAQLQWVERYYTGWASILPANADALAFYAIGLAPGLVKKRHIDLGDLDSLIVDEQDPDFGFIVRDNAIFAEGTAPNRKIFVRGFRTRFLNVLQGSRWLEAVARLRFVEGDSPSKLVAVAGGVAGVGLLGLVGWGCAQLWEHWSRA